MNLPANQIGETTAQPSCKDGISSQHVWACVQALLGSDVFKLCLQDDRHNHTIDSHSLAEDDTAACRNNCCCRAANTFPRAVLLN